MKKKIGYLLLILISILGSRLIFGKDYHLNSNNIIENNLYLYDIFNQKDVSLLMVDDEYLYYVLSSGNQNNKQYHVIKYNLIANKITNEYQFNTSYVLKDIKMFTQGKNIYLTAINSNVFYVFNKNLELINEVRTNNSFDSYGILNDKFITTLNNQIYINERLYTELPNSCGRSMEIVYSKDTYFHFYNQDTDFGCLYNMKSKKIEYFDYLKIDLVNNRFLEYQDNRLSFKYDNNTYYFNDIMESNNLKMHNNGDYLFTIDVSKNMLKIYNLETQKIIYERILLDLNNGKINNILIDDYAYFTVTKDNTTKLYIWDYLKEQRNSKDMISYNEKEYKFKNNELKEEIKSKYNIDVYIYDQAATYFKDFYVIASYDDILINSRLSVLRDILSGLNDEEKTKLANTKIFFEKSITSSDLSNNLAILTAVKDNNLYIAIDITDDNFRNTITEKVSNLGDIIYKE